MPTKPTERAVLIVSGNQFKDWETVQVIHQLYAPFFAFRFTCSEGQPLAGNFSKLQIKPGDQCQITLAGQPAFEGEVTERQVFYDARRHHIQISGKSHAEKLTHASVTSKTGEFNKVTFEQLCRSICKPLGINFTVEGGKPLPSFTFPRVSIPPSHSAFWRGAIVRACG